MAHDFAVEQDTASDQGHFAEEARRVLQPRVNVDHRHDHVDENAAERKTKSKARFTASRERWHSEGS